jgi:integrase
MASLELRNKTYRVVFMYGGHKYGYSLDTGDQETAEGLRGGVEKTLMLLSQGILKVPEGADVIDFVRNGGTAQEKTTPAPAPTNIQQLKERYLEAQGAGAMEDSSLTTTRIHLGHIGRTLGERFHIRELTLADLQRHVNERRKKKYRGRPLSPATLKKEVATFRAAWNWAALNGLVGGPFPSRGLLYPKADEKPPFMTWPEVERRLAGGGLSDAEAAELWESLYLRKEEIEQLLTHVREKAAHPWVYPLVCAAAHTGARRSELLRVQVADVNFDDGTVLIREKKRSRKQRTTRRVPLTPTLKLVLEDWLAVHPGGPLLFCQAEVVARSKKRSLTTGHKGEKTRGSGLKARLASVRSRPSAGALPVTRDEAHDHLRRTLAGSKWEVLKGFHVLRHSFISCLAAAGVDQRIIDELVGHQTDEQRRRYRHLIPDVKHKAIAGVFG